MKADDSWAKNDTAPIGGGSHKKDSSVLRSTAGSMPGSLLSVCHGTYEDVEQLCTLTIKYTTDFGLAVRGLLKDEDVGQAVQEESRRKRRRDEEEDDDVVEVVKEEENVKPSDEEYTVSYNDDGNEVIALED